MEGAQGPCRGRSSGRPCGVRPVALRGSGVEAFTASLSRSAARPLGPRFYSASSRGQRGPLTPQAGLKGAKDADGTRHPGIQSRAGTHTGGGGSTGSGTTMMADP